MFGRITKLSFLCSLVMFNLGLRRDFINSNKIWLNLLESLQIHSMHNTYQLCKHCLYLQLSLTICSYCINSSHAREQKWRVLNLRLFKYFSCYASNMCSQTHFFQQSSFHPVGFANITLFFFQHLYFILPSNNRKNSGFERQAGLGDICSLMWDVTFRPVYSEQFFSSHTCKKEENVEIGI